MSTYYVVQPTFLNPVALRFPNPKSSSNSLTLPFIALILPAIRTSIFLSIYIWLPVGIENFTPGLPPLPFRLVFIINFHPAWKLCVSSKAKLALRSFNVNMKTHRWVCSFSGAVLERCHSISKSK